ncbi:UNVERIFIED_CONTAM: hypothetical protein NCL1_29332 [Trichonephila clavipes]
MLPNARYQCCVLRIVLPSPTPRGAPRPRPSFPISRPTGAPRRPVPIAKGAAAIPLARIPFPAITPLPRIPLATSPLAMSPLKISPLPARAIGATAATARGATWLMAAVRDETVAMEGAPAINPLPSPNPRGPEARMGAPRAAGAMREAWAAAKAAQKMTIWMEKTSL